MNNVLIIIDPQVDFITGSMTVEGAKEKMIALKDYIEHNPGVYGKIILTLDWHPVNHCSFAEWGGIWPRHCVEFTQGALPYPPLYNILITEVNRNFSQLIIRTKGKNRKEEEYGAFSNYENPEGWNAILTADEIHISGIMSEYCVLESLKGIIQEYPSLAGKIKVLLPFIATGDEHRALIEYCDKNKITYCVEWK